MATEPPIGFQSVLLFLNKQYSRLASGSPAQRSQASSSVTFEVAETHESSAIGA